MADQSAFVRRLWKSGQGQRPSKLSDESVDTGITLMTYNILANVFVVEGDYSYCPADIRYMRGRHHRILQEIAHNDPDVVCLQEVAVTHFESNLKSDLSRVGYEGIHMSYMRNEYADGLAIFYKRSQLLLLCERRCPTWKIVDKYFQVRHYYSCRIY